MTSPAPRSLTSSVQTELILETMAGAADPRVLGFQAPPVGILYSSCRGGASRAERHWTFQAIGLRAAQLSVFSMQPNSVNDPVPKENGAEENSSEFCQNTALERAPQTSVQRYIDYAHIIYASTCRLGKLLFSPSW